MLTLLFHLLSSLQYYPHGSLYDLLKRARSGNLKAVKELSWQKRVEMLLDIASGMQYLHQKSPPVIHGDLRYGLTCATPESRPALDLCRPEVGWVLLMPKPEWDNHDDQIVCFTICTCMF